MSIAMRNISKTFGSFHGLNDVSIDIPSGELVALLGLSGCGENTLLRIIAGLEYADQEQIFLEGDNPSDRHVMNRAQVELTYQDGELIEISVLREGDYVSLRPRAIRVFQGDRLAA